MIAVMCASGDATGQAVCTDSHSATRQAHIGAAYVEASCCGQASWTSDAFCRAQRARCGLRMQNHERHERGRHRTHNDDARALLAMVSAATTWCRHARRQSQRSEEGPSAHTLYRRMGG
jgi:hypothetical protein